MSELASALISIILGGGALTGIVQLFKARTERRHTQAEAEAIGITTPLQAESLSVTSMQVALNSVLAAHAESQKRLATFKTEMEERINRIQQEADGSFRATQLEMNSLREAFQAAEEYVGDLLDWSAEHLPGVKPPERRRVVYLAQNNREDSQ